jgi:hypothetical protein
MAALALMTTSAWGQNGNTAPPVGTVGVIEGQVSINQQPVQQNTGAMTTLRDGDVLEIGNGHAEVLLTPGVFLRLGNGSALELMQSDSRDTRLRLLQGSAILEADELYQETHLGVEVGQGVVEILQTGLYRFDANVPAVNVVQGEVAVMDENRRVTVGSQQRAMLDGSFNTTPSGDVNDELAAWSRSRSQVESQASVASAQYAYDNNVPVDAGWVWNPWVYSYTWIPARRPFVNFYGFSYWSPAFVYRSYPTRFYGAWRPGPVFVNRPVFRNGVTVVNRPVVINRTNVYNRPLMNRPSVANAPMRSAAPAPNYSRPSHMESYGHQHVSNSGHSGGARHR